MECDEDFGGTAHENCDCPEYEIDEGMEEALKGKSFHFTEQPKSEWLK